MMWGKANEPMQQQLDSAENTQLAAQKTWLQLNYRWMSHFFTEDDSAQGLLISRLQRRAVWIALAFMLQALSTTDFNQIAPFLKSFSSLFPLLLMVASFFAIWMALRPSNTQPEPSQNEPKRTTTFLQ